MVYISDLQGLVSEWIDRLGNGSQPISYKDALNDCAYDLQKLIDRSITDELDYQDMLDSWEADNYLSSMEAHEAA